jgi:hypothetical protein
MNMTPVSLSFRVRTWMVAAIIAGAATVGFGQSTWEWRNPSPYGNGFGTLLFTDNHFIILSNYFSSSHFIMTSADGVFWKNSAAAIPETIYAAAYGNNRIVAIGWEGIQVTSDGITWMRVPMDSSYTLTSIAYGNGSFVAVGYTEINTAKQGIILSSVDGISWNVSVIGINQILSAIAFGNGWFATIGSSQGTNNLILASKNLQSWIPCHFASQNLVTAMSFIAYGNDRFIIWSGTTVVTSPDGVIWTAAAAQDISPTAVAYGNGKIVGVGVGGNLFWSNDGLLWSAVNIKPHYGFSQIAYGNGTFVATGSKGEIATSADGVAWTMQSKNIMGNLSSVTYGNGTFVALQSGPGVSHDTVLYSHDAKTWTFGDTGRFFNRILPAPGVCFYDSLFLGCEAYFFMRSRDGITWEKYRKDMDQYISSIAFGKGIFVGASGAGGGLYSSTDGAAWIRRDSGNVGVACRVVFVNDRFIALVGGDIFTSSDGLTWIKRFSSGDIASHLLSACYGNGTYVAIDISGAIDASAEGIVWKSVYKAEVLTSIVFGNGWFVAVGNGIYTSRDGYSWTKINAVLPYQLNSIAYGDSQFVAVSGGGTIIAAKADPSGVIFHPAEKPAGNKVKISIAERRLTVVVPEALPYGNIDIVLFSAAGKRLFSSAVQPVVGRLTMQLPALPGGAYFLSIARPGITAVTTRFVVVR